MTEKQWHEFMQAQAQALEEFKWLESEKAGRDLGNDCCLEWVLNHSEQFYNDYIKKLEEKKE